MLDKIIILGLNTSLEPSMFSLMNSFISSMTLGSSPIAALISLRLVILSIDSSFFRVTKLAAWGERYFSCLAERAAQCSPVKKFTALPVRPSMAWLGMALSWAGERVEASHPMLRTSDVFHDPGPPYIDTRSEERWAEARGDKEHSRGAR